MGLWPLHFVGFELLRKISADADFFDRMNLGFEKVGVPLFVLNHVLEEVLGSGVSRFAAYFDSVVVLTNGVGFILVVDFKLLLDGSANLGREGDVDNGCVVEKQNAFDEVFGVMHFLEGAGLGQS